MQDRHPVFNKFEVLTSDAVPVDIHWGFLGELQRKHYDEGVAIALGLSPTQYQPGQIRIGEVPALNDEYFEWIDVLESAVLAQDRFTMIELGAGYGRWLVRGALATRCYHPEMPMRLIGVEAEPTHFEWMKQHFRDNKINPDEHELIEAAVDEKDGEVFFHDSGDPDSNYGQSIARDIQQPGETIRRVKAVSLTSILDKLDGVDLIDLDIQGAEYIVLRSAIDALNRKVKRIHIGTHGHDIERDLRKLFREHGWYKANDYSCQTTALTEWGEVVFGDGVQTWINPLLSSVQPTQAELGRLQRMLCSLEQKNEHLEQKNEHLEQKNAHLQDQLSQIQALLTKVEAEKSSLLVSKALADSQAEYSKAMIAAMESSKFWKIREMWFRLRQALGLDRLN
jgi:FkbM family methyltransferase